MYKVCIVACIPVHHVQYCTYSIAQILPKFHLDIHCTKNVVRDKRMVWIRMVKAELNFLLSFFLPVIFPLYTLSVYKSLFSFAWRGIGSEIRHI